MHKCPCLSSLFGLSQRLLLCVFVPKNAHLQAFWNGSQSLSLAILSPFHLSLPRTATWPGAMKVMDAEEEKFHETLPRSVWLGDFGQGVTLGNSSPDLWQRVITEPSPFLSSEFVRKLLCPAALYLQTCYFVVLFWAILLPLITGMVWTKAS